MADNDGNLFSQLQRILQSTDDESSADNDGSSFKEHQKKIHTHLHELADHQKNFKPVLKSLQSMNQEISKPASLACFPAEQFKKIEMACTEVNKNLIQLLHDWTNLDKKMRQDWDSKLQRCQELFAEIENEMALIRKGKKDGQYRFVEMIDAIAESLEIIGFDQALMEVSKVILEDYQEDGELIPDGARLRFRVSDKPEKSGAATRISLKVNKA